MITAPQRASTIAQTFFPTERGPCGMGVTHNKLAEELKTGALKQTPSIHGRILTSIRDMHKQLWVARVAILREQGNTSQPFKRGGAPPVAAAC